MSWGSKRAVLIQTGMVIIEKNNRMIVDLDEVEAWVNEQEQK